MNAALTPRHRERLGRYVIEKGWTISAATAYFHVSWPTTQRWAKRYAEMGCSRPHRALDVGSILPADPLSGPALATHRTPH